MEIEFTNINKINLSYTLEEYLFHDNSRDTFSINFIYFKPIKKFQNA